MAEHSKWSEVREQPSDEELASLIREHERALAAMRKELEHYRAMAHDRLIIREATEGVWGNYIVREKEGQKEYHWDSTALERTVKPLLATGEWEAYFTEYAPPPYFKPNNSGVIMRLAERRGGALRSAIMAAHHVSFKGGPHIEVQALEENA